MGPEAAERLGRTPRPEKKKFDSLQVLRGAAASAVVLHHALRAATANLPAGVKLPASAIMPPEPLIEIGALGVDIFFILSGFLMIYISGPYFSGKRSIGHFISQRLIRIWPLYAAVTMVVLVPSFWIAFKTGQYPFNLHLDRLASFIFIPSFDERGLLQPILGVGWTLNYEILFYLCFALVLLLGKRYATLKLSLIITAVFVAGQFATNEVTRLFLGNAIMFEFLFGALLATSQQSRLFKLSHGAAWLTAGLCLLLLSRFLPLDDWTRPITVGLPMLMIFIGFLALDHKVKWPPVLKFLGDASYSIYLVHILIIYRVNVAFFLFFTKNGLSAWAVIGSSVMASLVAIAGGVACFLFVERPLLRTCQGLYNRLTDNADKPPLVSSQESGT